VPSSHSLPVATRSHRIEYRQPALLDDELEITTWLSDLQDHTVVRHTVITRPADGASLSRARTVHAWVDLQTGEPVAIPELLVAALAPAIAE
jgi:acyl-CoA thioester hydrolase